jgi:hypothetical protein
MQTVIQCDPELLRPVIEAVVNDAVVRLVADWAKLTSKLAYTEAEAARLLSLRPHQLRDERRRAGSGLMLLYTAANLLEYLAARPYTPTENGSIEGRLRDGG